MTVFLYRVNEKKMLTKNIPTNKETKKDNPPPKPYQNAHTLCLSAPLSKKPIWTINRSQMSQTSKYDYHPRRKPHNKQKEEKVHFLSVFLSSSLSTQDKQKGEFLARCKMEIGIYFLSVIYLHVTNCKQWFKKHTMHKTLQVNCFLIFNAMTTLLLVLLTIPDCSVLHIFSHLCAAVLSLLCQWL